MGTKLQEILDMAITLIPKDVKLEVIKDIDLAERGTIEMAIALDQNIVFDGEGGDRMVDVILSLSMKYLASYFTYRCYLMRLKDELNRDAINFKTLTFEIKGLEKRPEAINDSLYQVNRYLQTEIDRAKGTSSVIGVVTSFGGSNE